MLRSFLIILSIITIGFIAYGQDEKTYTQRTPSALPTGEIAGDKPIEVHGQTRNLNMLLKLQSEREEIDFIKLRKDYEEEIEEMNY